jgi:hypothetical protein
LFVDDVFILEPGERDAVTLNAFAVDVDDLGTQTAKTVLFLEEQPGHQNLETGLVGRLCVPVSQRVCHALPTIDVEVALIPGLELQ